MAMGYEIMHALVRTIETHASLVAAVVTAGVALLLACCLGCSNCSKKDKDDLFSRHEL